MKILLIYPQHSDYFWSFKHVLKFISKKAALPPLGLITLSAMLPKSWKKKLVDMNVSKLDVVDIILADYVFISAMYIQKESVNNIIKECIKQRTKIVAGGLLFTKEYSNYPEIDHFVLNEAEITLPQFLADLLIGQPKHVYQTNQLADLTFSPVPDFHLLQIKKYASMNMQVSRGCPFDCDFCEITALQGLKVRMKSQEQVLDELETLYKLNWRGPVAVVDDNFIGNKKTVKDKILPSLIEWMDIHHHPFRFNAQTSINLADDEQLLNMMCKAGFNSTFIGIETPVEESLQSCHKIQNENRDLLENVKQIQKAGLLVSGGFIVGFDSDTSSVFQRQVDFIQKSGIVSAMVGLLNAPKNTRLYQQMKKEDRLTTDATGGNIDFTMNFKPKMDYYELMDGYKKIINNIYASKPYYKRVRQLFLNYNKIHKNRNTINFLFLVTFLKSILIIGIVNKGRGGYWKLLFWTLFKKPGLLTDAITFAIYGYHFRTIYGNNLT